MKQCNSIPQGRFASFLRVHLAQTWTECVCVCVYLSVYTLCVCVCVLCVCACTAGLGKSSSREPDSNCFFLSYQEEKPSPREPRWKLCLPVGWKTRLECGPGGLDLSNPAVQATEHEDQNTLKKSHFSQAFWGLSFWEVRIIWLALKSLRVLGFKVRLWFRFRWRSYRLLDLTFKDEEFSIWTRVLTMKEVQMCQCSCTCYILGTKILILLAKWRHFGWSTLFGG